MEHAAVDAAVGIRIRPAHEEDTRFLAWAILVSARGHLARGTWELIWPFDEPDLLDFLEELTVSDDVHWCHLSSFVVAEDTGTGRPVGALSAFDPTTCGSSALAPVMMGLAPEFGLNGVGLLQSLTRARIVMSGVPEYEPDAWAIENVACAPEHRGRGIVGGLLERALSEGFKRGFRRAQVNFFVGNGAAEHVYRKAGFRPEVEKRNESFEKLVGAPGMRRFIRDIP